MTKVSFLAVIAPFCLAACSGSDGERIDGNSHQVAPIDYCAEAQRYEFFPIGNKPQPTSTIADPFDARNGFNWFASKDATPDGDMDPNQTGIPQKDAPDIRCGDPVKAIRVTARGLRDWGGNLGYNFNSDAPLDGSLLHGWLAAPGNEFGVTPEELEGMSFWVRLANCETDPPGVYPACEDPLPLGNTLFASVTDEFTTQVEGCEGTSDGCACLFNAPTVPEGTPAPDPTTFQCDAFGTGVGFGPEWRFFTLRFDEMLQRGYGRPSPQSMPGPDLLGVSFGIEIGTWDLWLDDIAFFRTRPDAAAP
jgi:hypothetical protein